jgi:hypothetical protein
MLSYLMLSYLMLSYLMLSYLTLSYMLLFFVMLSLHCLTIPYAMIFYLMPLRCAILSYLSLSYVACIDMSHDPRISKIRFPSAVKISLGADALRTRKPICKIVFFFVCKYLRKSSKIAHNFVLQNNGFLLKNVKKQLKTASARAQCTNKKHTQNQLSS